MVMRKKKSTRKTTRTSKSMQLITPAELRQMRRDLAIAKINPFVNTSAKKAYVTYAQSKTTKSVPQQQGTRVSRRLDAMRKARVPGYRRSKVTGRIYMERRQNRSDRKGTWL